MSDPAVDAARRTSQAYCHGQIPAEPYSNNHSPGVDQIAEFAAREMAKPIREIHRPVLPPGIERCKDCDVPWPCATAKLIYTTEELSA